MGVTQNVGDILCLMSLKLQANGPHLLKVKDKNKHLHCKCFYTELQLFKAQTLKIIRFNLVKFSITHLNIASHQTLEKWSNNY